LVERERQEAREAKIHKTDFIKFMGSILTKQDRIFDVNNLPNSYDETKAASDTEEPNTEDVGNFVRDKLAKVIKPEKKSTNIQEK
jgi:hypothetical protein